MKTFTLALSFLVAGLLFDHASAQVSAVNVSQGIGTMAGLINAFTGTVIKALGSALMASALVVFFYGLVEFIWASRQGDGPKIESGKKFMVWSLVGLFVMFSVYGIIKLGQSLLFNGQDVSTIVIPELNFIRGAGSVNGQQTTNPGVGAPVSGQPIGGSGLGTGPYTTGSSASSAINNCLANGGGVAECTRLNSSGGSSGSTGGSFTGRGDVGSSCQYASDCNGALQCVLGKCAAGPSGGVGSSEPTGTIYQDVQEWGDCSRSDQCAGGLVCQNMICVKATPASQDVPTTSDPVSDVPSNQDPTPVSDECVNGCGD